MKMSRFFFKTLHEAPADAEVESHKLLVRAGFIGQLAAGIFSELPLAKRAIVKIEQILREEMNDIEGQELSMPVVHPAEVWQKTKRWYQVGQEMGRFKDRNNRDMVLAMTHEEVVADLVRKEINSYRQLPQLIYHFKTKWRDEARPRAGLIRVREFTMKDSYSLDMDWDGLDVQYKNHYQAYFNIFNRCSLPTISVKSDVGMMGGQIAHEFMYLSPIGEDTIIHCDACKYSANRQVATFAKQYDKEEPMEEIEKVSTPETKTIEELSEFLVIPASKTAKAVMFYAKFSENDSPDKLVFALTRGDLNVNETKVGNAVKAKELRPALEEEMAECNIVAGYASPVGIKNAIVVVDEIITKSSNLVVGANEEGFHLLNTNFERDYKADIVTDISVAESGAACPKCGNALESERGVEVGNIFKLGTRYSESMGCKFLDKNGREQFVIMGSYGIGSGRLLQCIVEEHNDERGIIWPMSVAPYQVHLIVLQGKKSETESMEKAEAIYNELKNEGIEVLFDERKESPGSKFSDADLIGLPIRLTVSTKTILEDGVEFKLRRDSDKKIVSFDQTVSYVKEQIDLLKKEIQEKVINIPYVE